MRNYRPKALINGYKLNLDPDTKYIAVPKKHRKEEIMVYYQDDEMLITRSKKPEKELQFEDKFNRGKYTLQYFEWKPDVGQVSIFQNIEVMKQIKAKLS